MFDKFLVLSVIFALYRGIMNMHELLEEYEVDYEFQKNYEEI